MKREFFFPGRWPRCLILSPGSGDPPWVPQALGVRRLPRPRPRSTFPPSPRVSKWRHGFHQIFPIGDFPHNFPHISSPVAVCRVVSAVLETGTPLVRRTLLWTRKWNRNGTVVSDCNRLTSVAWVVGGVGGFAGSILRRRKMYVGSNSLVALRSTVAIIRVTEQRLRVKN